MGVLTINDALGFGIKTGPYTVGSTQGTALMWFIQGLTWSTSADTAVNVDGTETTTLDVTGMGPITQIVMDFYYFPFPANGPLNYLYAPTIRWTDGVTTYATFTGYILEAVYIADPTQPDPIDIVGESELVYGFNLYPFYTHDEINGNNFADLIYAVAGDDTVNGNGGADSLYGDEGNDSLSGGSSNDLLVGGAGFDTLDGGAGADTASYIASTLAVLADLTVTAARNVSIGGVLEDRLIGIEHLIGGSAADQLSGNGAANRLQGQGGNDTLGGAGGNDALFGGAGNDVLFGGSGNNRVDGGNGRDAVTYQAETLAVHADLSVTAGANVSIGGVLRDWLTTIENLAGGAGNDTLLGSGAAETLVGNGLNDSLVGRGGSDVLFGGLGRDTLLGEAGDDILRGNAGADVLTGGSGRDRFVFSDALSPADRITDFVSADDTINIDRAIVPGLGATLTASEMVFGPVALDAFDRLIYNSANGQLIYDSNGNTAGGAIVIANLGAGTLLVFSDIVLI